MGDVAEAISEIDQSYSYTGVTGHTSESNGSDFLDLADDCDTAGGQVRHPSCVVNSACIVVVVEPSNEG
jgi:hypothetical protein